MELVDHLIFDLTYKAEIQNAIMGINTPAELVYARQYGYNDTSKRINIYDGVGINYLLQDNDISIDADFAIDTDKLATRGAIKTYIDSKIGSVGTFRDDHNASGGTVPTATEIKAGDFWRVSVGGTIAGLSPVAQVNAGDLIFAKVDDATNAADFFAVQGNFATAAEVALLSTGTYGGSATNVQDALEELYFQTGNGVEFDVTGTKTLKLKYSDFISAGTAAGTPIPVLMGSGGKLVMDSTAITAAIGNYIPMSGTAGEYVTGEVLLNASAKVRFHDSFRDTTFNPNGLFQVRESATVGVNISNSVIFGSSELSLSSVLDGGLKSAGVSLDADLGEIMLNVQGSGKNAMFYNIGTPAIETARYAIWNALPEQQLNTLVPSVGYVKSLISGGGSMIDFASKAGDGINYTGSIYNIDLDTNSGLELNGTSPNAKLRIKGLADYTAAGANQVAVGYGTGGNLVVNKSLLATDVSGYLPLAGNTAGTPITGDIYINPAQADQQFAILDKDNSGRGIIFSNPSSGTDNIRITNSNGSGISAEIRVGTNNGIDLTSTNSGYSAGMKMQGFNQALSYLADYHARWNSLTVMTRDRIVPDIGYVKTLITGSVTTLPYLPLTGTGGTDKLSGTVNVQSGLKFELTDTTNKAKLEFLNSDGFTLNSNSADDSKRVWLKMNGSTGTAALFTQNQTANNAEISLSEFGATITALNGANNARATMSLARKGFFYDADYNATWNGLAAAERDRMIPDIAYVSGSISTAVSAAGRQSFDITGTGSTKTFVVTHSKGTFPIVQLWRVDTNQQVAATVTNISATQVQIDFAANVPLNRVHKVVII